MTPKLKEEVLQHLDALIQEGQGVVAAAHNHSLNQGAPGESRARAFMVAAAAEVARIAGRSSEYFLQLPAPRHDGSYLSVMEAVVATPLGVLLALRSAVAGGFLELLETRVRAALHDDFVQQAVDLLAGGYHIAAMVIIGGVLENRLRDLCRARPSITLTGQKLSHYNDALLRIDEYTKAAWRQVQVVGDLRNDAAHALYDKVSTPQVDDAVRFVQRFLSEHEA